MYEKMLVRHGYCTNALRQVTIAHCELFTVLTTVNRSIQLNWT